MRVVFLLLSLLFIVAGIVFGALNPQPVRVDFYWFALDGSLGAMLLVSALLGATLGGAALLTGVIWPLQRRLRRSRREQAGVKPDPAPVPSDAPLAIGSDRS
jgi:lipopolysaccharide assembly protein A